MMRPPSSLTTYSLQPNTPSSDPGIGWFAMAQGFGALGSAYSQGTAAKLQYDFQAQQIEQNVRLSEIKSEDAIRRGKKEATKMKQQTKQVIGSQRANFAAQNIAVDEGSALDIQAETAAVGAENALIIENNAWAESWGYKVEAVTGQGNAQMTRLASSNVMGNTLLTGGLQAVGYGANAYYLSNRKTTPNISEG